MKRLLSSSALVLTLSLTLDPATAQPQPQPQTFNAPFSLNILGGELYGNTLNIGPSQAALDAVRTETNQRSEEQKLLIAQLIKNLSIQEEQIQYFFKEVKASDISPSRYGVQLVEYARRYNALQGQLQAFIDSHPTLGPIILRAKVAIQENRLQDAQDILRSVLTQSSSAKSEAVDIIELQALTEGLRFDKLREGALYLAAVTLTEPNSHRHFRLQASYAAVLVANGIESSRPDDLDRARVIFIDIRDRVRLDDAEASVKFDVVYAGCLIALWQFRHKDEYLKDAASMLKAAVARSSTNSPAWIAATNAYSALAFLTGDAATALRGVRTSPILNWAISVRRAPEYNAINGNQNAASAPPPSGLGPESNTGDANRRFNSSREKGSNGVFARA